MDNKSGNGFPFTFTVTHLCMHFLHIKCMHAGMYAGANLRISTWDSASLLFYVAH